MPTNERRMGHAKIKINGSYLEASDMDALVEIVVDSSLHLPDMVVVTFHDDQLERVNSSKFPLGGTIEVEVSRDDEPDSFALIFKGEITAVEPNFGEQLVELTIRGYDKSYRLHRGTTTKVWLEVKDSDIASAIAGNAGLSAQIDTTTEVYKHVYQNALSDMEFLQQRAARIGYEVYVQDDKLHFKKPDPTGRAIDLEWGVDLRSFQPRLTVADQVSEVTVKGWDHKEKKEITGKAASSKTSPETGFNRWGGPQSQSAISKAVRVETRHTVQSQADADAVAQGLLDYINSGFIEAEGEVVGHPELKAGVLIKITKLGDKFNGTYKLTTVRHVYSAQQSFTTYFTVEGPQPQILSLLLGSGYTYNGNGDSPEWSGVVPAIVTNNADSPEGDAGYVKIKYPWLDDQQESFWARVAGTGFGAERGIYFMPEVNDEVLVAFERGDFNRPYVIGSLFNGKDAPPTPVGQAVVDGAVKTRIIRSRTGHTIRMVDKQGGEEYIEIIDAQQNTSMKMDAQNKAIEMSSQGDIKITSVGNITLEASGKIDIKATQALTMSGQTVDVSAQSNMTLKANGTLSIKGMTLTAEGTATAEVKGGASLTLQAAMIRIN